MSDRLTIVNPSSSVNLSENEFANLKHVRTELHRHAKGISLVWRFEADGNPDPSNVPGSGQPAPQKEERSPGHEILTTDQIAKELGLTRKTVRKLITDGFLEALPGVCPYMVTREALNRYLCGQVPRKDPDPSAENTGNNYVPPRRKTRRTLTGLKTSSGKPKEDEVKRAVEDMKKWEK